ncbi:STAS domain-containing protein [Streptomyces sp. NPDC096030]|uniref:STAS domain-containing protein n=1 Tax=Streptomyces sp. NPDC096030 TaxID=3155423 RepID=UPI0033349D0C
MTAFPDAEPVVLQPSTAPQTLCLALVGDLGYENSEEVLELVGEALRSREDARTLRLDCRRLDMVDSTGLSALLQIHRWTQRDGVDLYLDHPGPVLERVLRITGTYEHLTAPRPPSPRHGTAPQAYEIEG